MSTLKRIPEAVLLGVSITVSAIIGIALLLGKITISESWFSLRTLQISLGSGLFALLFMYVQWDKKNLSPNDLKYLVVKSKVTTFLLLGVFLWTILSQPTIPVTVSFKGVAKTADVISTKRDVQKTNENVTQVGATVSSFKEKQEKKNDDFLKQLFDLQNKVVELDKDERVRQEAASDQVASVANDLKKVSVGVEDVKNIGPKTLSTSVQETLISEKNRVQSIFILIILGIVSITSSFFYQGFTKISVKMRRYGLPGLLFAVAAVLYFFPAIVDNMPSMSKSDKKPVVQIAPVKKETLTVVDSTKAEQQPKIQVQLTQPVDSVEQKKSIDEMPDSSVSKKRQNKKVVWKTYSPPH